MIDALGDGREVLLFDSAGVGRSSGTVPTTIAGMAAHALDFLDASCVMSCDVLGFSLGGMVAQQMALDRPSSIHRMILVGTAPRGGDDIMHLEKPSLARHLADPALTGFAVLQKIFFASTSTSQSAGAAFLERLALRTEDLDTPSGPDVAAAQIAAFREWELPNGEPLRPTGAHPPAPADRKRDPRRDDPGLELLSVGREPAECQCCSCIRTPDTARSFSFTSPSPVRRRHSFPRTRRLHPTD